MKWRKKYNIDLERLHQENIDGASLIDLAIKYNIPRTTINRYLNDAGYTVMANRKNSSNSYTVHCETREKFTCVNAWKRRLIARYGYKCMVCGYDKFIEAHHIQALVDGGETTIANGILLCPNHHAEAHSGILNLALLKRDELLENPPREGNQQPSLECNQDNLARVEEGSTTSSRAKAVMEPRASRSHRRTKEEFCSSHKFLDEI